MWLDAGLNRGPNDFQSFALPTELPSLNLNQAERFTSQRS